MEISCLCWHPTEKNTLLSSGLDGSLRLWNLEGEQTFGGLICKHVLKIRNVSSGPGLSRIAATCCAFSPNGKQMAAGTADGWVHIWQERKVYSKVDVTFKINSGHSSTESTEITSIVFLADNLTLLSREEGFVKIWNTKKHQAPMKVIPNVFGLYPTCNICLR